MFCIIAALHSAEKEQQHKRRYVARSYEIKEKEKETHISNNKTVERKALFRMRG